LRELRKLAEAHPAFADEDRRYATAALEALQRRLSAPPVLAVDEPGLVRLTRDGHAQTARCRAWRGARLAVGALRHEITQVERPNAARNALDRFKTWCAGRQDFTELALQLDRIRVGRGGRVWLDAAPESPRGASIAGSPRSPP
jgi:hypothetical protein